MATQLTSDQQRDIDLGVPHVAEVIDPRDNRRYVIISADEMKCCAKTTIRPRSVETHFARPFVA